MKTKLVFQFQRRPWKERKRPKLVSRRPPRGMIGLREAMICLREAMICLREAMICLHEAMICLHEAMILLHEPMICLHEPMICLHEAMICLGEATIGLQGVRRICRNWWLSNENLLRSRSRSTSFINASHRAENRGVLLENQSSASFPAGVAAPALPEPHCPVRRKSFT